MAAMFGRGLADPALVSPHVAHLAPLPDMRSVEQIADEHGLDPQRFAALASNENPLGPSTQALEAVNRLSERMHGYPSQNQLQQALARKHGVSVEQVFIGAGSSEIIELLVRTFVGPGQTVVGAWPSFAVYRMAAEVAAREFLPAPLRHFRLDLASIAALCDPRTKLVFLANPNNPTGTHLSLRALVAFLHRLPQEAIVVIDEAYAEYVEAEDYPQAIVDLLPGHPRLVVLRTFSKVYGLAGLRVGYAVMAPALVRYLRRVQPSHSVNALGLIAAHAALSDDDHVHRSRNLVLRERQRMAEGLRKLGLDPVASQTNFIFVPGLPTSTAADLEAKGVLVRSMLGYGVPDAIRVSVGSIESNTRFLDELDRILVQAASPFAKEPSK